MKKADVRIGGVYHAKVTNKKVEVRIDEARTNGGWLATNLSTGKKVTIKTAQRLTEIPIGASAKRTQSKQKNGNDAPAKKDNGKMSCIQAALLVLTESNEPMNAKEMIEAMETRGYWQSPGGKTPHATLYSAILRDISKGDDARFEKVERGRFVARG